MSAAELRRAASLMRERASEVWAYHSSPWRTEPGPAGWSEIRSTGTIFDDFAAETVVHDTYVCQMDTSTTAEHIASWHPAVALAVADWLDAEAESHRADLVGPFPSTCCRMSEALAVARAYLGADA